MERGPELLRMTIYGQAAGAGSKTAFVVTRGDGSIVFRSAPKVAPGGRVWGAPILNYSHASKKTAPWMRAVEREAGIAWAGRKPLTGALWLDVLFYEARPDGHYHRRDGRRLLRPDAPAYPAVTATHDVDKLRRAISDSLTNAKVLADDKRVVGGEAWKDYIENIEEADPKVVIRVGRMAAATVADLGVSTPAPEGQRELLPV